MQRRFRQFERNGRPINVSHFNVDDVDAVLRRRRAGTLSASKAAALRPEINIRTLIVQLSATGHSTTSRFFGLLYLAHRADTQR
jgi:hypothetical protein